jgi:hypothetical protein
MLLTSSVFEFDIRWPIQALLNASHESDTSSGHQAALCLHGYERSILSRVLENPTSDSLIIEALDLLSKLLLRPCLSDAISYLFYPLLVDLTARWSVQQFNDQLRKDHAVLECPRHGFLPVISIDPTTAALPRFSTGTSPPTHPVRSTIKRDRNGNTVFSEPRFEESEGRVRDMLVVVAWGTLLSANNHFWP